MAELQAYGAKSPFDTRKMHAHKAAVGDVEKRGIFEEHKDTLDDLTFLSHEDTDRQDLVKLSNF